jgi:uncharacterized protein (DUF1330 family)
MAAYVMFQVEVHDPARYEEYKLLAQQAIADAGGRYLIRGGAITPLEGTAPTRRTVMLEFADRQAALDWYHGDGYAAAKAVRQGVAVADAYIIDGVA